MSEITIPKYTIDMDSLVKMFRDDGVYNKNHFKTLWDNVSELIEKGVIISHIEVYKEIEDGYKDDLFAWAKANKETFRDYNVPDEAVKINEISDKFPMFSIQNKEKPSHADPWLVSQAMLNDLIIITEEKGMGERKITRVCMDYDVKCIDLFGLIRENGWVM